MQDLLQNYSLSDILIFIIFLALAIKDIVSFFDWVSDRSKKEFNKEHFKVNEKEDLERRLQKGSETMELLTENQEKTDEALKELSAKIDMLIESDRDDIKAYITREHHYFCYEKKWIDDFSLDCIEKRHKHYQDEGGNSFIQGLMDELKNLPKVPPEEEQE